MSAPGVAEKAVVSRGDALTLRVAFAGASGTGKSTLAERVREHLGLPMNPVGSRSVARAMGFENPYDVDAAGRRAEFQRRLMEEKVGWEARQPAFVTDRTTVDQLAYQVLHDVRSVDQAALDAARAGLARYTHVFLCPVDAHCDPAGDPARVSDLAYHRAYEALLTGLLARFGARLVVLDVGSLEARVRLLSTYLGWAFRPGKEAR